MTKRTFLLIAAITLSCGLSVKATSSFRNSAPTPVLQTPAFAWNFVYAFGNGAISGLSWSGDYLYVSSGSYMVWSVNGYALLTPSNPVYCSAVDNESIYVQIAESSGGGGGVSYYDFQNF